VLTIISQSRDLILKIKFARGNIATVGTTLSEDFLVSIRCSSITIFRRVQFDALVIRAQK